jgi:phenylalanyl-tRNA synthetase beta chain
MPWWDAQIHADRRPLLRQRGRLKAAIRAYFEAEGFTEVSNYSFISEEEARRFGLRPEDHIRVLNPIAAGQELMRTSLIPGIHRNIVENARHFEHFRIFEVGHEIHKQENSKPIEKPHLMLALYAKDEAHKDAGRAGLMELKRVAQFLAPGLEVRPAEAKPFEHSTRAADLLWRGEKIGRLAELHPHLVETGRAAVLDLDLELLRERTPGTVKYTPVRRFPTSAFDLSVVAPAREHAGTLESAIRSLAGPLAEAVEYVREYQGAPLPEDRKSVSFRVVVGAPDKTLSTPEILAIRDGIIAGLTGLGYELRI